MGISKSCNAGETVDQCVGDAMGSAGCDTSVAAREVKIDG